MEILKSKVIKKIDAYLSGKTTKKSVSAWAIGIIYKHIFTIDEMLLEDAITALAGLHDENERWDTAEEDLKFLKECLEGKKSYLTKVEMLQTI
ncbi:MAG: hypothetical protein HY769_04140 [Candidatus Stahlbacteria bacterium]|nr:hypothetical protein [Candidatus Stahlbacteria bacterium]